MSICSLCLDDGGRKSFAGLDLPLTVLVRMRRCAEHVLNVLPREVISSYSWGVANELANLGFLRLSKTKGLSGLLNDFCIGVLTDEFPLAHLLQPFREYYLQAEHSVAALIQIR